MHRHSLTRIDVWARPGNRRRGWIAAGPQRIAVALGRSGIKANKREGDGATPAGSFRPLRVWWRSDRAHRPSVLLPCRPIGPADGWCEDPRDRRYNRPIRLPPGAPGDRLTRADGLYDLIIEIDHNARPRIAGRGSAVFIHVARPEFRPHRRLCRHAGTGAQASGAPDRAKHENRHSRVSGPHNPAHPPADAGLARPYLSLPEAGEGRARVVNAAAAC